MATVNLVPGTQYLAAARARRTALLAITAGVILITLLVWGGLMVWGSSIDSQATDLKKKNDALQTKLTESQSVADRISLFENRVGLLDTILNNHTSMDPVLKELERLVPGNISLNTFNANAAEGTLSLAGNAPTPDDVAQLVASLNSTPAHPTLFSHVELKSITRKDISQDGAVVGASNTFTVTGTFNPTQLLVVKTTN